MATATSTGTLPATRRRSLSDNGSKVWNSLLNKLDDVFTACEQLVAPLPTGSTTTQTDRDGELPLSDAHKGHRKPNSAARKLKQVHSAPVCPSGNTTLEAKLVSRSSSASRFEHQHSALPNIYSENHEDSPCTPLLAFVNRFSVSCEASKSFHLSQACRRNQQNEDSTRADVSEISQVTCHLLGSLQVSNATVALALLYIDRLCNLGSMRPTQNDSNVCGHCLVTVSLMIAEKYLQDRDSCNEVWAAASGLSVHEINRLERLFLGLLDYRLFAKKEQFDSFLRYYRDDPHRQVFERIFASTF